MAVMEDFEFRSPSGKVLRMPKREAAMLAKVIRRYLVVAPSKETVESHRDLSRLCDEIELLLKPPS